MSQFPFEIALDYLKRGGKVAREAWKDTPKYVFIDYRQTTLQCFVEKPSNWTMYKQTFSYTLYLDDLLAEDWVFVLAEEGNRCGT